MINTFIVNPKHSPSILKLLGEAFFLMILSLYTKIGQLGGSTGNNSSPYESSFCCCIALRGEGNTTIKVVLRYVSNFITHRTLHHSPVSAAVWPVYPYCGQYSSHIPIIVAHQPYISAFRKTLIAMYEMLRVVGRGRECA